MAAWGAVGRVGDKVVDKELIYEKLPADIAERHVLVMDPILATGNSAVKAIQARPPHRFPCPLLYMHGYPYGAFIPWSCSL